VEQTKTLSEYTWVSAAQYIQWLEFNCQLKPVNLTHIWSMRVTPKTGFPGLLSKKIKLEAVLKDNRDTLEQFVNDHELGLEEVDIIGAFVGNIDAAMIGLAEQIDTLKQIVKWEQENLTLEYVDTDLDEPPF